MKEVFSKVVGFIAMILRSHKKKLAVVILSPFIFVLFIFPYDDIGDWLTTQVALSTNNQVFLQFDDLGLNLFPFPALDLETVSIDTPFFPAITADNMTASPTLASIFKLNPMFVSIHADSMFNGDVDFSLKPGRTEKDFEFQNFYLNIEKASLKSIKKFLELNFKIDGISNLELDGEVDLSFNKQPSSEVKLEINEFSAPSQSISIPQGGVVMPVDIPALNFSKVFLKGRLTGSTLTIENGDLGSETDPFNGKIKGKIAMRITRRGGNVEFGAYEFKIKLNATKSHLASDQVLKLYLNTLWGDFRSSTNTGSSYTLKVSAPRMGAQPRYEPTGSF